MLGAVAGLAAMFLMAAAPAEAVHKGAGDLTCGACHTMHNSQGAAGVLNNLGGADGGSIVLLRADISGRHEIHKLCLQCHASTGSMGNGTTHLPHNNEAPKVLIKIVDDDGKDVWQQGESFNRLGAGGNFWPEIDATTFEAAGGDGSWDGTTVGQGKGHSLGLQAVTPPGGDTVIDDFTCTSCHDPHGVAGANDTDKGINLFRNLKMIPTDSGEATQVALNASFSSPYGGIASAFVPVAATGQPASKIWPVFRGGTEPPLPADSNSYGANAGGISDWCAQCHDAWHEDRPEGSTNNIDGQGAAGDWRRHPVNEPLAVGANSKSGADVQILDFTNYLPGTAGRALPVAKVGGTEVYYREGDTDKIMCLSCHFVHGGPYNDNLRWDYTSAVGLGTQTGNAIDSTVGCQLCHNR